MTELRHVDDHVLISHQGSRRLTVECPYVGNPERRRDKCGLLEQCPCDAAWRRTRDKMEFYFGVDLEMSDWIDGYDNTRHGATHAWSVDEPMHGDSHETCPHTGGRKHHVWEGEVMVAGTACSYEDLFREVGWDLLDDDERYVGPGRYVVDVRWYHEESEIETLTLLDVPA